MIRQIHAVGKICRCGFMRTFFGILTGLVIQVFSFLTGSDASAQSSRHAALQGKSGRGPQKVTGRGPASVAPSSPSQEKVIPLGNAETERAVHSQGSCPDCGIPKRK